MIKSKMKSVASILIVFALLISSASAAVIQPRWTYIASIVSKLDISESGYATLYGGGSAPASNVNKVKVIVELQQFKKCRLEHVKYLDGNGFGLVSTDVDKNLACCTRIQLSSLRYL